MPGRPMYVVHSARGDRAQPGAVEAQPATGSRPTDAVLVAAARGGNRWAQEALFRRHASLAMGLAYRLLGSDADLEDVVQDAYFSAFSRLDRLEDPQAFAAWLASMVVRKVQTLLRHRRLLNRLGLRPRTPLDPDLALSKSVPPEAAAELRGLYGVIDTLSTQARLVLVLREVEGYSLPEISAMLNCSLSTAKRRLKEAEQALAAHQRDRS